MEKGRRDLRDPLDGSIHLSHVLLIILKLQEFAHRNLVQVVHLNSVSEKTKYDMCGEKKNPRLTGTQIAKHIHEKFNKSICVEMLQEKS
ncbi:hypothetical protein TNCV_1040601 [Trichonephila clavipes]|nr:hypothetical protein TNCV_1040601 [Trichonephila clavipes]